MPIIAFISKIRTVSDNCTLNLIVRHRLLAGELSEAVRVLKTAPPQAIDVLLPSPLIITVSGMLNGTRISPEDLNVSCVAQHLVEYLRVNSDELGVDAVSEPYIPDGTGLVTFSCTGCRPYKPTEADIPHLKLVGFDMDYRWQEKSAPESSLPAPDPMGTGMNPFSRRLALPYLTAMDDVVKRFVTFQVVKRYPLIFGSWSKQLDAERKFFCSIFASIQSIVKHSPNIGFQQIYKKHIKICRRSLMRSLTSANSTLSAYLGTGPNELLDFNDEAVFTLAMESIYRRGTIRPQFKSLCLFRHTPDHEEDELLDNQHTSSDTLLDFDEECHSDASSLKNPCQPQTDCQCQQDPLVPRPLLMRGHDGHPERFEFEFEDLDQCRPLSPLSVVDSDRVSDGLSDFGEPMDDSFGNAQPSISLNVSGKAKQGLDISFDGGCNDFSADEDDGSCQSDDNILVAFHQGWSPDTGPSQGKLACLPMGLALGHDYEDFLDFGPHKSPCLPFLPSTTPNGHFYDPHSYTPFILNGGSYGHSAGGNQDGLTEDGFASRGLLTFDVLSDMPGLLFPETDPTTQQEDDHGALDSTNEYLQAFSSPLMSGKEGPSTDFVISQEVLSVFHDADDDLLPYHSLCGGIKEPLATPSREPYSFGAVPGRTNTSLASSSDDEPGFFAMDFD